jgi:RNA polymerase primary sigma factor
MEERFAGWTLDAGDDGELRPILTTPGATLDPVADYFHRIGTLRLLTAEEELECAKRVEIGLAACHRIATQYEGFDWTASTPEQRADFRDIAWVRANGEEARCTLIERNLRLVVSRAKRFAGRGMDFLDLIQEGNIGLIHAVDRFDYTRGLRFSTYATRWIDQAISHALSERSRAIRVPVRVAESIKALFRVQRDLEDKLDREPTLDEVAEAAGFSPAKVLELRSLARDPISISTPLGGDGDGEFGDLLEDSDAIDPCDLVAFPAMRDNLNRELRKLAERDARIVSLRFGLHDGDQKPIDEIAELVGVSTTRIHQILSATLRAIRESRSMTGYFA